MTQISVTYTMDEARFMRACHVLWAHRGLGRIGNYLTAGLVGLCAAFLLWQNVPGVWAWLLLVGVAVFVFMDIARARIWRKYYQSLAKYRAPMTASVSHDGMSVDGAEGHNQVPWSHFQTFLRTDAFIFLIIDQRQFSVIPLDAFETPQQATAFEGIVTDHLKRLSRRYL